MSGAAVVAWVEEDPEVVGDAAELAEALGGEVWAVTAAADPGTLATAGAARVLVADPAGGVEALAAALTGLPPPRVFLVAGTAAGNDLAPRLAAGLGGVCLLDCARVLAAGEGPAADLVVERWAHDDRAQERWLVPAGPPAVVALRPGGRGAPRPRSGPAEVVPLELPAASARPRRRRRLPPDPGSVPLAEAERIVAAGLGIGSRDLLPAVEELARLLGAAVGASRPLADRGWVPFERQIGTTGQQVAPRLYLAIGISGATQHLGGIREAETVVAVNTDPACPMMARATLAAVGDAGQVVPALVRRLRQRRGAG
ncbi:MAG TPA: electron transfer flavoprotein subunit alpha/FixB family protein [Candidatus Dormibacteraeota bacterium]|nr:electron transfer flavoprotein subunit alpha/FixB family protein [Candidatus Dormibacteraeota bacterium]